MKAKDISRGLSWERLNYLLDIYPETGKVKWRNPQGKKSAWLAGRDAGEQNHVFGYVIICIDGVKYKRHRLVWFATYKKWPQFELDHIDRNRKNDCIFNLRDITKSENMRNVGIIKSNKSGFHGVSWDKRKRKWRATRHIDGKHQFFGYFASAEQASIEYELRCRNG